MLMIPRKIQQHHVALAVGLPQCFQHLLFADVGNHNKTGQFCLKAKCRSMLVQVLIQYRYPITVERQLCAEQDCNLRFPTTPLGTCYRYDSHVASLPKGKHA